MFPLGSASAPVTVSVCRPLMGYPDTGLLRGRVSVPVERSIFLSTEYCESQPNKLPPDKLRSESCWPICKALPEGGPGDGLALPIRPTMLVRSTPGIAVAARREAGTKPYRSRDGNLGRKAARWGAMDARARAATAKPKLEVRIQPRAKSPVKTARVVRKVVILVNAILLIVQGLPEDRRPLSSPDPRVKPVQHQRLCCRQATRNF